MMRVLLLTLKLGDFGENKWLTDELAREFADRGVAVDVVLIEFNKGENKRERYWIDELISVDVHTINNKKTLMGGLFLFWQWLKVLSNIKENYCSNNYDLVLGPSIATIFHGVVGELKKKSVNSTSIMILWDFFPVHHVQIGRVSAILSRPLYYLEKINVSKYDCVGLMSEQNRFFFNSYFGLAGIKKILLPIWGGGEVEPRLIRKKSDVIKIIFGGQLCKGRGIEQLLALAASYPELSNSCQITIMGDGPLYDYLEDQIKLTDLKLLKLQRRVTRLEYLKMLHEYDFGLVITTPNVDVPTFPSKSLDYMIAGVPIIACVEKTTDFGHYIENVAQCGVSVFAGDNCELHELLLRMVNTVTQNQMIRWSQNAQKAFYANHRVSQVVDIMLKNVGNDETH